MKHDRDACAWRAMMEARKVVREHRITALPVDPIALAKKVDIAVMAKDASSAGVSGMLLRVGNAFGIAYATHIDNAGFQRFSVGHELGHYFIPGHIDAVLAESDIHESRAGFGSSDRYEIEADHFCANLLMPQALFKEALNRAGEGLEAIEQLSDLCVTSLTATAIRFSQCTDTAAAIVVSSGDRVEYCFMSEALKEVEGLEWIRKGESLPSGTTTSMFNGDSGRVTRAERIARTCDLQDWFGGNLSVETCEEVVGLGIYGKTLTVLTPLNLPDPEDMAAEEELTKSWEPKFRL